MTNTNSKPTSVKTKIVTRYQILYTSGSDRRASTRLYDYATARKLVSRLNRHTKGRADAHAYGMRVRTTK